MHFSGLECCISWLWLVEVEPKLKKIRLLSNTKAADIAGPFCASLHDLAYCEHSVLNILEEVVTL